MPLKDFFISDRRNTLVAFKDAISESGRKLSLMVSDNQQRALESLLADIQGAAMSPRRKALYSLMFFMGLVILYWTGLALADSFLALRENLTGLFVSSWDPFAILSVCKLNLSLQTVINKDQCFKY